MYALFFPFKKWLLKFFCCLKLTHLCGAAWVSKVGLSPVCWKKMLCSGSTAIVQSTEEVRFADRSDLKRVLRSFPNWWRWSRRWGKYCKIATVPAQRFVLAEGRRGISTKCSSLALHVLCVIHFNGKTRCWETYFTKWSPFVICAFVGLWQGWGTYLLSRAAWIVHYRRQAAKSIHCILNFNHYLTMKKRDFLTFSTKYLSTCLSWSFVLTRCCTLTWVTKIHFDAGHNKCSRGPHVPHPWFMVIW